ncbi:MAG: DUF3306 domain-containing protein [Gammaproteobacteria bacterium]|nr:DUF3306 domain-containing protein [Gammaproteobacteria bacterium]
MKTKSDTNEMTPAGREHTDEDFLSRWSRRKHEAQQSHATPTDAQETPDTSPAPVAHLTDADMPPIESLTEDSDYTGFLSPKVSEALRKQALRKLFQSASFNVRDGLDDYDEDFTEFAKLGDIVTVDLKHRLEMESKRKPQAAQAEPGQQVAAAETSATVSATNATQAHNDDAADADAGAEEKTS